MYVCMYERASEWGHVLHANPVFFQANFFLAELLVGFDQVAAQLRKRLADLQVSKDSYISTNAYLIK